MVGILQVLGAMPHQYGLKLRIHSIRVHNIYNDVYVLLEITFYNDGEKF